LVNVFCILEYNPQHSLGFQYCTRTPSCTQTNVHARTNTDIYTEHERESTLETQETTFSLGTHKVIIATHCKFEPFCGVLMLMRRFETNCFDSCGHQLSACNIIVRVRFGRVLDVSHSFFRTRSLYTHVCGKIPQ